MPPTKGGTRPPKGGKGSGKGKGTRAPLPSGVAVAAAGGKASAHSGGTRTRGSVSKRAASDTKARKKSSGKPRRKAAWQKWATYIHKLQQSEHRIGLSRRAMAIVGAFIEDMFDRLTVQASTVARMHKRAVITAKEVMTAARLVLPTEFATHSMSEGTRAVTRYNQAREEQKE